MSNTNTPVKSLVSTLRIPPSQNQYLTKGLRQAIADILENQEAENARLIESNERTQKHLDTLKSVVDSLSSETTVLQSEREKLVNLQEALQKENVSLMETLKAKREEHEVVRQRLHGTLRTAGVLIDFCDEHRQHARTFFEETFGFKFKNKDDFKAILSSLQQNIKAQTDESAWSLEDMFQSLMIGGDQDKEALPPPSPIVVPQPKGDPTVGAVNPTDE